MLKTFHVSPMITVEKLTEKIDRIDKYMRSTLFLFYNGVDFVTESNAIMKIHFRLPKRWHMLNTDSSLTVLSIFK